MNFKNFTVKGQLSFAFGLLAALVILVSLVSIHALSSANASFTHYNQVVIARTQLVVTVRGGA